MLDPPKVVTDPNTNRARHSLISLMWRTLLPLRQIDVRKSQEKISEDMYNKNNTTKIIKKDWTCGNSVNISERTNAVGLLKSGHPSVPDLPQHE